MDTTGEKKEALDTISGIAPPQTEETAAVPAEGERPVPEVREGADADDVTELKQDPSDPDAKLNVELDETFPGSDAPSTTRPGSGEPAPSSGYDEEAEKALAEKR